MRLTGCSGPVTASASYIGSGPSVIRPSVPHCEKYYVYPGFVSPVVFLSLCAFVVVVAIAVFVQVLK